MTEDTSALFEIAANAEIITKKGRKYAYLTLAGEEIEFVKKQWDGILEEYPEIKERITEAGPIEVSSDDEDDDE